MRMPLLVVDLHHADDLDEVVATYVLLHDIGETVAQRAVNAFHYNAEDLVDVDALMLENGIRDGKSRVTWTDSTGEFLSSNYERGILKDLPKGVKINGEVWKAFIALCVATGHIGAGDGPTLH